MANVKKSRRVSDADIKRLNHVGLGLKAIAQLLGCHPATVTQRLDAMGVDPTDTRRSFMEKIFVGLKPETQEWLSHNLYNTSTPVSEFIIALIEGAHALAPSVVAATPAPMPEMQSAPSPTTEPATELTQVPMGLSEAEFQADEGAELVVDAVLDELRNQVAQPVVVPEVEPEKVETTLKSPVCGVCRQSAVETEGTLCISCQTPPTTQTTSVFG